MHVYEVLCHREKMEGQHGKIHIEVYIEEGCK